MFLTYFILKVEEARFNSNENCFIFLIGVLDLNYQKLSRLPS